MRFSDQASFSEIRRLGRGNFYRFDSGQPQVRIAAYTFERRAASGKCSTGRSRDRLHHFSRYATTANIHTALSRELPKSSLIIKKVTPIKIKHIQTADGDPTRRGVSLKNPNFDQAIPRPANRGSYADGMRYNSGVRQTRWSDSAWRHTGKPEPQRIDTSALIPAPVTSAPIHIFQTNH